MAKWKSMAMGQAERDPGCHSSHCPLPVNKGLLVWVQGPISLAPSCPVFHLFSCFPTRPAAQSLGPRAITFPRAVSNLLWGLSVHWSSQLSTLNKFSRRHKSISDAFLFFRDSTFSHSAKGLRVSLPKLSHLILDIGEEFVKNIVFCMTDHCNTQSIWYFKSTKFHFLYAQYSI